MQSRQAFILLVTIFLIMALLAGFNDVLSQKPVRAPLAQLENVRDYVSAITPGGPDYAIDGGRLFVGHPGYWVEIPLPEDVIAGAVDVRMASAVGAGLAQEVIYVGAANQLTIYRTTDRGENWLHGRLTHELVHKGIVGGVTDLAVDPVQRLVYVGTDTAGLFRVRDSDGALTSSAQLLLEDPVLQVVTDRYGRGMTFVRTEWALYRGADFGLQWAAVDSLGSVPTAMALTATEPATIWVGTADRGLLRSEDGESWMPLNHGLTTTPALPLYVNALAVDPIEPATAYVSVSYLSGTHFARYIDERLAYTRDGGATWSRFEHPQLPARVTDLMPVSGYAAAVYVLTTNSRAPQAIGDAPAGAMPALVSRVQPSANSNGGVLAWIAAGLAALALAFALVIDVLTRPEVPLSGPTALQPRPVRRNRWP